MTAIVVVDAGGLGNFLRNRAAAHVPTSEDALFGLSYLSDGEPGTLFKFGANADSLQVLVDLNIVKNGGFETWPGAMAANWIDDDVGTGNATKNTGDVHGGANAVQLDGAGTSDASSVRPDEDYEVPSGSAWTVEAWIDGDGTNLTAGYLQNLDTGRYLDSSGAWVTSQQRWGLNSFSSYVLVSRTFTVEAASVVGKPTSRLRLSFVNFTGVGRVDDVAMWPHWNFAGVFGHNLTPTVTVKVQSGTTSSPTTDRVTFALRKPGMYGLPASIVTDRWLRLLIAPTTTPPAWSRSGANFDIPAIGEFVIGQKTTLPRAHRLPTSMTPDAGLLGQSSRPVSGRVEESMGFPLEFVFNDSQWASMKLELARGVRWGGKRLIFVPLETAPDVYFGTFAPSTVERMASGAHYRVAGEFQELEYSVAVP